MKKLISICLTICMLLSMVSITNVFAATWPGAYGDLGTEYKNGYVSTVDSIKGAIRNGDAAEAGVDYQASSSDPWGADGCFNMITGDWAYIVVDMPYTGVYAMQMKTEWTAGYPFVMHVTSDEGYAAEYNITSTSWSSGCKQDQPMYLKAGTNVLKFKLVGSNNGTISSIDFGALNATNAEKSLDFLPLVKLAEDLVVPTPEPTPTPKPIYPEGWDGVVDNHPDVNFDAEALVIEGWTPNKSSEEGDVLFGTDWGTTDGTTSVPNKGQASAIYLAPGASATYTVTVTNEGVYGAQVKMGTAEGPATLQMTNNVNGVEYISQHTFPNRYTWQTTWSNGSDIKADDLIYLQAGANEITISNVGSYGATYEKNDFGIIADSMQYIDCVGTTENPAGVDPEGWDGMVDEFTGFSGYEGSITALSYNEYIVPFPYTDTGVALDGIWVNYTVTAPAAGMYLVDATAADNGIVTLTTEVQDYVTLDFDDYMPAYIWLEEGDNLITATGDADFTNATFYPLKNSDDYLSQKNNVNDAPDEATDLIIRPYTDRTNEDGFYQYDSYEAVVQYAGSSMTYDVNCFYPGIYRVQAKIGGTSNEGPIITVDTDGDEGYRAQLATTYADDFGAWRQTDADGEYVYVYLKEGINKVSVTAGASHHVLWGVEFKLLTAEEEATITMDDLTKTPPKDIVINPHTDKLLAGGSGVDYYMIPGRLANDAPMTGDSFGVQLIEGEWMRFEVSAKKDGYYKVSTTAATYTADASIIVESEYSTANVTQTMSPDNYKLKEGTYIYLEEGTNSIWVRNMGSGWMYLQKVILSYTEDDIVMNTVFGPTGVTSGQDQLTFFGKVSAEYLGEKYGVEVNGKKFYGAKDGDIVSDGADGTKTFTFGEWDGSFDIILQNITEKGTAGEKTYRFFVGDYYTNEAVVTVE